MAPPDKPLLELTDGELTEAGGSDVIGTAVVRLELVTAVALVAVLSEHEVN